MKVGLDVKADCKRAELIRNIIGYDKNLVCEILVLLLLDILEYCFCYLDDGCQSSLGCR